MDELRPLLLLVCGVFPAVVGGIFFAFSSFVMRALGRIPPAHGINAMQSINVAVLNPVFMATFLGAAVLSLATAAEAAWHRPAATGVILAGAALYLAGTFGVTAALNVPLNERLASVAAESHPGQLFWAEYVRRWTVWNHVRTAAAIASAVAFLLAALRSAA